jgi:arylsulfatase A-like enzyme
VLLLVVSGLRPDHLGAYGYRREPSSPHFDTLARSSLLFVRAYAASAQTRPSLASILTGLAPTAHGIGGDTGVMADQVATLAERLRAAGYETAAVAEGLQRLERDGLLRGFDRRREPPRTGSPMRAAVDLLDELASGGAPWLLLVYQTLPTRPELRATAGRYATRVRAADAGLGELVARLAVLDADERTLIAITADHGVSLADRSSASVPSPYEELIRVPLLLRPPRGVEPRAIQPPVSLLSLAPTLIELTGVEPGAERFPATTLSEWLFGDPARRATTAVFSQLAARRAVIETRYKLIRDSASGEAQLFDLAADPGERRNLAGSRPELHRRLELLLSTHPEAAKPAVSPQ